MNIRARSGMGGTRPSVKFEEPDAWYLYVCIEDGGIIVWASWSKPEPGSESAFDSGGGIIWANGRLTALNRGDTYDEARAASRRAFHAFIESVGLSFGTIEAELRSVSGYQEEQRS